MTVLISQKASDQLTQLFDYLETNFSPSSRKKFQSKLDRFIGVIKLVPQGFPESDIFPDAVNVWYLPKHL